jgi:hypothetical protein
VRITLNSNARWTQQPTDKLPIGNTTDPRQCFRTSVHSSQCPPRFSSVEATPLVTTAKVCLKEKKNCKFNNIQDKYLELTISMKLTPFYYKQGLQAD